MEQFTILIQYGEQFIEDNTAFPKYSKLISKCSLDSLSAKADLLCQMKSSGIIKDFVIYTDTLPSK